MQSNKDTPAAKGYRMPAEWEPQESIWLAWPHNLLTFEDFLEDVEKIFVEFMKALYTGQYIDLLINDDATQSKVVKLCQNAEIDLKKVCFHKIPNQDVWTRDYGPTFIVNRSIKEKLAMVKWTFNAWGSKYDDLLPDNEVTYKIQKELKLPMFEPKIVLEGGSIDVNGQGLVLTSEQCLLNENRNPQLSKEQIEDYLKQYLNVNKVLWLKEGIAGDDTDGHIDDIARFVNPDTIVCAFENDSQDENYEILKDNYKRLMDMTDQRGKKLNLVKMPMPGFIGEEDERLPASYLNFYIGNEAVVVPIFGHKNDMKALSTLEKLFPKRKVVGINCTPLVYGFGTLHCSSQQQPKI